MAGETNRLLALAKAAHPRPDDREADVLASTGEQVTSALTAIVLQGLGVPARSFLGHQIRIDTDDAHGKARILRIDAGPLRDALAAGTMPVVAGFQGVTAEGRITTLGRGGTDTTAVALAAALGADVCEIYTDVDGVYTSDPRMVPKARKLKRIAYDEMLELASLGAKVLQIRSVEFAKRYRVPVHVRSSFDESEGTWVIEEDSSMEDVSVAGVAADQNEAKLTVRGAPLRGGGRGRHRGGHDHPERERGRHHRPDLHRAACRLRQGARAGRGRGAAHRRPRRPGRPRRRQGVDRRRRHADARRHRGAYVRRARPRRDQHPDDLDVGDQDLGGRRRQVHGARGACPARRLHHLTEVRCDASSSTTRPFGTGRSRKTSASRWTTSCASPSGWTTSASTTSRAAGLARIRATRSSFARCPASGSARRRSRRSGRPDGPASGPRRTATWRRSCARRRRWSRSSARRGTCTCVTTCASRWRRTSTSSGTPWRSSRAGSRR